MLVGLPVWAYGAAANTLTSQLLGSQRKNEIMPMLWKSNETICHKCICLRFLLFLLFPYETISIYTDNKELATYSLPSLYIASGNRF